ncbi:bifunctional 4-hydroxy-2-oxoglutarate aldolase/2-dehydro-3-deoxy-phosphogluconate aldolase [Plantibacter sp. PA-3-X8]|uniref:2-dehydro-3-deoxyphosphogluconate aldolase / (4S)-4-hydroxy-2-oxoglutarate aldolase n=1 Tax=Plantibacter cousiniae (nom. nud.) TaxID=199709 RepID=A0ABY1LP98_9MICO|nr:MULTISPECIES: bifunctional 4-hydroxy-2-oxoglutarate aldolase/2-dehydro-3-deoxy-phosphogluconate aldolase [Plantibacter]AZH83750.1 bifunctional 4-hydroxy-2-oxoglutarate aldolase/2-dehydro-3-deoxy-phosphogluconate aldolase [Plantibacter sp. PA-3-X8]MBF4565074.1 bifunctional 4-hydroxy-2-oxoglutarate aldolase/2-dehydro-3-deoxy-phosphogluconate aldolase [Plantibacter sp. VKM Ac-2876]SKC57528.1 2-dehydro-3-deoxyphosphogluconate aldolase / (4S)-4-hydroxy-2-oxoglutarate aldolase [Plantibacter cousini
MLTKYDVLRTIHETGAILILRLDSTDEAIQVARAAIAGGFRALEITLSVPDALGAIRTLSEEYADQGVAIGAGTVLDAEAAFACIQAGARILVSPNLDEGMIRTAARYQAVSISGAFTPTEIVDTMSAGADIVKLFPTEIAGPEYLKTVRAPLAQAPILPAGGATPENVGTWFAAGAVAVGVGSAVTKAARADGDYGKVTRAAEEFLAAIAAARA